MECKYIKLLNKYLDKELSVQDQKFMDEHLLNCPVCNAEFKCMIALRESFAKNRRDSNAEFFWQQLKKRIIEEREPIESSGFLFDFGNWAKRLIPVPVVIGVLAAIFLSSTLVAKENLIDRYLFDNSNAGVFVLSEEADTGNLGLSTLLY